jgi:hypothetical protein
LYPVAWPRPKSQPNCRARGWLNLKINIYTGTPDGGQLNVVAALLLEFAQIPLQAFDLVPSHKTVAVPVDNYWLVASVSDQAQERVAERRHRSRQRGEFVGAFRMPLPN